MNTFGLCFTFLLPGIGIGIMAGLVICEMIAKKKANRCGNTKRPGRKLFIYSLKDGE